MILVSLCLKRKKLFKHLNINEKYSLIIFNIVDETYEKRKKFN